MKTSTFPYIEYIELCTSLECYHEIFSTLFKICIPKFTEEIDTAAVAFNRSGACVDFLINENFWRSLSPYTKEFVICHEMCHVVLSHGIRQRPYLTKFSPATLNVALDLAVNHLLTLSYNFNRFNIDNWQNLCWADTVFKELQLEPNRSFEYYISKIEPMCQKIDIMVSDHSYLSQFDGEASEQIRNTANETNKTLDKDKMDFVKQTIKEFEEGLGRSDKESDLFIKFTGDDIKYKNIKKWESVLKKAVTIADKERESTQWVRTNRRITCLDSDLLLPSDHETTEREAYKYKVWLFLDYSGSCESLKQPFFRASQTFDPKKFEVRKFAHCTQVQEFKDDKVTIPGYSTSFSCIEKFIQNKILKTEIKKYPDFVFLLTDGCGNAPDAQYPDRWFVFLSKRHSVRCFNDKYNLFPLNKFILEDI